MGWLPLKVCDYKKYHVHPTMHVPLALLKCASMEYVASPARAWGESTLDKPTSLTDANSTSLRREDWYQGGCFMFLRLGTGNLRQIGKKNRVIPNSIIIIHVVLYSWWYANRLEASTLGLEIFMSWNFYVSGTLVPQWEVDRVALYPEA